MRGDMADNKTTRSRRIRKVLRFPQIKGKVIAEVELSLYPEYPAVDIRFQDKTAFTLGIHPCFQVTPVLADWKTGDYKQIKRWKPILSD
jgi:hypothetical protein